MTISRIRKGRFVGVGLAMAGFLVGLPTGAISAAADGVTVAARPDFQLPVPCGQKVRLESFGHAPALDIFRVPVGETEGNPLTAPADGVVNKSYFDGDGAGNILQINHGGGWFTTSIHLQSRAVGVGARVTQGQLIGRVGHTGETSNGVPHLHFEQAMDQNGDGEAEWGHPNDERVIQVFNGVAYGENNGETSQVTSYNCGITIARDFSGDGKADVLARHVATKDLYLFRGNGSGGFLSGSTVVGDDWSNFDIIVSAGDFDGDGDHDVIARHATTKDLYLFRGNGSGGFLSGCTVVGNDWSNFDRVLSVGDFTGDRKADLIARLATTKDLYLFRGNGSGGFLSGSIVIGNNWINFDQLF